MAANDNELVTCRMSLRADLCLQPPCFSLATVFLSGNLSDANWMEMSLKAQNHGDKRFLRGKSPRKGNALMWCDWEQR